MPDVVVNDLRKMFIEDVIEQVFASTPSRRALG
jgi:hypothetical protein